MTKLRQPLLSLEAHGTLGDVLTFSKPDSKGIVRRKPTPAYRLTLLQQYQRWDFLDANSYWETLTDAQKSAYRSIASRRHISIYAAFIQYYLANLPDIAGRWRLNTIAAGQTPDSSRNTNTGTVYGAQLADGLIDRALSFDGNDDYINCGNGDSLNITQYLSILLFLKIHSWWGAGDEGIITKGTTPERAYLLMGFRNSHRLRFQIQDIDLAHKICLMDTDVELETWYHIAATYDKQNLKLYLNGQQHGQSVSTKDIRISPQPVYIGAWTSRRINATIDHVILLNRALSGAEILKHSLRRYPS